MSKLTITSLVLAIGLLVPSISAFAQDDVRSLRGEVALDEDSVAPEFYNWQPDSDPIPRDFVQQPPLIPHDIRGYTINLRSNKCLSCHSWTNYKAAGATKISQTHFSDRMQNVMADVAARRYFCNQCHVPQMNARPLVQNEFEPLSTITGR